MNPMERNEQDYRAALDSLRFSEEAKKRMMNDLMEQKEERPMKKWNIRPLRVGLIAACLCLALMGTAFAVNYLGINFVPGDDGIINMQGGTASIPYDSLSDEIKALGDEPHVEVLPSWEAAEKLIGVNLMDNPVLDNSPAHHYFLKREGKSGTFLVSTGVGLCHIYTFGCFEIGDVDILARSVLYTEHEEWGEEGDETFLGIKFPEDVEVSQDTYAARNGLTAQIMEVYYPEPESAFECIGAISLNGIPTVVECMSDNSIEEARVVLFQVLDGFQV